MINQYNGQIFIYRGLSSSSDVPLMTMNSGTFMRLPDCADSDLNWKVSWENAPAELKMKAIQTLRDVFSKTAN